MSDALDPAIAAALDALGLRAQSWRTLSAIRTAQHRRTTVCVDLADGERVKARAVEDAATARRLADVRRHLPAAFAPILHVHGSVLVEAWIEGAALTSEAPAATLDEAARLLASLHRTSAPGGREFHVVEPTADERARADAALARLATGGHVDVRERAAIGSALARLDPGATRTALVHTDFCAENMVVDAGGRLNVIDNERVGVGAPGLDVARTWYRWPLAPAQWERFAGAYAAAMPDDQPVTHFAFWALVATLKSAALRLDLAPAKLGVALAALRTALALADCRGPVSMSDVPRATR